jgi:pSer/pThr/pTyr-binding forkhead associated (FHA) protein
VSEPTSFALRFISGKYQGGEFSLADDRETVIGRGGELDIVLVEDMVSRKHAKITTGQSKVIIEDLGSTNGTFVNGEKITKKVRLKEGDRVLIGTSILKLIPVEDASAAHIGASRDVVNAELDALSKRQPQKAEVQSGSLSELALGDVITVLATQKKDGVLYVTDGDEHAGRIYMREGRVFYAILDENDALGPMKALARMVGFRQGGFDLHGSTDETFLLELDEPTDQLIADASRQTAELQEMLPSLPEPEDMLIVQKPLETPLSSLRPEELDVFQTVFNQGFVQAILDRSPFTDLQTYKIIQSLIEKSYIHM